MKVFLSWSGHQSKKLAEAMRDWLPAVLQAVRPYFTPSDIEKGARWSTEIARELEESQIGLLCVTRDNLHSDWVLFEAGALSKSLDKSHVCPLLFGIATTDLAGPLKQFQSTEYAKDDFHKLVTLINGRLGDQRLQPKVLDSVFEKWWPEIDTKIAAILQSGGQSDVPIRSEREMLQEVLELTRLQARLINRPGGVAPAAVYEMLQTFIALHDEQEASLGSYQDTLDGLKKLSRSIGHIGARYRASSKEIESLLERFRTLSYTVSTDAPQGATNDEDDIPF